MSWIPHARVYIDPYLNNRNGVRYRNYVIRFELVHFAAEMLQYGFEEIEFEWANPYAMHYVDRSTIGEDVRFAVGQCIMYLMKRQGDKFYANHIDFNDMMLQTKRDHKAAVDFIRVNLARGNLPMRSLLYLMRIDVKLISRYRFNKYTQDIGQYVTGLLTETLTEFEAVIMGLGGWRILMDVADTILRERAAFLRSYSLDERVAALIISSNEPPRPRSPEEYVVLPTPSWPPPYRRDPLVPYNVRRQKLVSPLAEDPSLQQMQLGRSVSQQSFTDVRLPVTSVFRSRYLPD